MREHLSLTSAAAIVYAALQELMDPASARLSAAEHEETLHLIASHIAIATPVYGRTAAARPIERIPQSVLARGHFISGAARLELDDGQPAYGDLAVEKHSLDTIIADLRSAFQLARGDANESKAANQRAWR